MEDPARSARQLMLPDVLAAVGCTVVLLVSAVDPPAGAMDLPMWARVLLVAGVGLPVAVRRRWPVPVCGVVLAMSVLATPLRIGAHLVIPAALALYAVALTQPVRRWVPTRAIGGMAAVGMLAGVVVGLPAWGRDETGTMLLGAVVLGGAWAFGHEVRDRRANAVSAAAQLAERAVTEERLRIARELHDIVAHSMGVIAVKAGVANHVLRIRPEEAHRALGVIEATSREALNEMRQLLGVLRSGDPSDMDGSDGRAGALAPAPGLAGLPALADRAALADVQVDLDVADLSRLPAGVELSVYRIVQEALTNVVKHAAPARCQVRVGADGDAVTVEVTDDGPGRHVLLPAAAPGHGLVGMRERVALYGGEFTAGPRPAGGFSVSARLPYRPTPW